jgi:uncharacterized protein YecE (DUF72 family)
VNFYPADLPLREWLAFYTRTFETVEINNTFYRLPESRTFSAWRRGTPDGFVIAVKASRYLTHLKKLRDPQEPVKRLFARVRFLGRRLGPVLYQLPGQFRRDLGRLEELLTILPTSARLANTTVAVRHAFEFRDASWYEPDTFDLLRRFGAALCLHDKAGAAIGDVVTAPFVYIRFHGPSGQYAGSYDEATLARWAAWIHEQIRQTRDVYAYFNNDPDAAAVRNAQTLRALVRTRTGPPADAH